MVLGGQSELNFRGIKWLVATYGSDPTAVPRLLHASSNSLTSPAPCVPHCPDLPVEEAEAGVTRSLGTDTAALDKVHIVLPWHCCSHWPILTITGTGHL